MIVIVGLGNFGEKYARTRHNVGFMTVDAIARKKGIMSWKKECRGLTASFFEGGQKIMLVKPQTYMNLSGECVGAIADYYDVDPEDIVVIYDDVDLPPGTLRVRKKADPEPITACARWSCIWQPPIFLGFASASDRRRRCGIWPIMFSPGFPKRIKSFLPIPVKRRRMPP